MSTTISLSIVIDIGVLGSLSQHLCLSCIILNLTWSNVSLERSRTDSSSSSMMPNSLVGKCPAVRGVLGGTFKVEKSIFVYEPFRLLVDRLLFKLIFQCFFFSFGFFILFSFLLFLFFPLLFFFLFLFMCFFFFCFLCNLYILLIYSFLFLPFFLLFLHTFFFFSIYPYLFPLLFPSFFLFLPFLNFLINLLFLFLFFYGLLFLFYFESRFLFSKIIASCMSCYKCSSSFECWWLLAPIYDSSFKRISKGLKIKVIES